MHYLLPLPSINAKILIVQSLCPGQFKVSGSRRLVFNRVIMVISVVLRETNLTISVSTGGPVSKEYEIVRVVSLSTTEISEITRLEVRSSGSGFLKSLAQLGVFNSPNQRGGLNPFPHNDAF